MTMSVDGSAPLLAEARVAIVGLGLMGGSLALALRGQCRSISAATRRADAASTALSAGVVDWATADSREAVRDADVVVLATPVRAIVELLGEIAPALRPGCLVMDLGSTKRDVVAAMDSLPPELQAVGGHPMCGRDTAGLDAADSNLYRECTFVLCPTANLRPQGMVRAQELVRAVGARPLVIGAERHDRLVAAISHLPYLIAAGLTAAAAEAEEDDPLLPQLASSGFRDTSRLAGSNVTMMRDILLTNRDAVLEGLGGFQTWLDTATALLRAGDEEALTALLATVQAHQQRLRS